MDTIELDLTDEEFCVLAKAAHELDMTFNAYIAHILKIYIDSLG